MVAHSATPRAFALKQMPTVNRPRRPWLLAPKARANTPASMPEGLHPNFYRHAKWLKLRAAVLRDEPFCRECMKRHVVTEATMVDHIQPIRLGGEKYEKENLAPLCDSCHGRKRQSEKGKKPVK